MVNSLDLAVNAFMQSIQTPFSVKLMSAITFIGDVKVLLPLSILLVLYLFYKKENLKSSLIASTLILGVLTSETLKFLVSRARPENALMKLSDYSFPSGHVLMSTLFFLLVIYLFKNSMKDKVLRKLFITMLIIIPILISFSRLYLNVHWLTDVIAGIIIGIFWTALFIKINNLETKR